MKTDILIVTYAKDFPWLEYCLQSIGKFARGFSMVTILVPDEDYVRARSLATKHDLPFKAHVVAGKEWAAAGMVWHMAQIMRADEWCPEADFILHLDPDCIFTEPVAPQDYLKDGRPILMHASFHWLITCQQANLRMWKEAAERALGWEVTEETMRRHPAVHYRWLYKKAREYIEKHTGQPCDDYIRSCRNEFPQGFAEFPTLGAVAWRHHHADYAWINQERDPFPDSKLVQFWSHSPPHIPQSPTYKGHPFECTPESLLASL